MPSIGTPFHPVLDTDPVKQYREDYRKYREGHAKGARGEAKDATSRPRSKSQGGKGELPEDSIFGGSDDIQNMYDLLTEWRVRYRAFRRGEAHGSEGEVGRLASMFNKDHLKLLPVWQLRALQVYLKKQQLLPAVPPPLKRKIHFHFGAGKLALGLIFKAMARSAVQESSRIVVVQRASDAWQDVVKHSHPDVTFSVNGTAVMALKVCRPGEQIDKSLFLSDEPVGAAAPCGYFLLHGSTPEETAKVDELISWAVSTDCPLRAVFSASLGPALEKGVSPVLSKLEDKPQGKRPAMYGCENDQKAVEKLGETLKGKVDTVKCMVDRICAERSVIVPAGGDLPCDVNVTAEPFSGEIVVLSPPEDAPRPAFVGGNVQIPILEAQARYFCQRKILCVNGMHTTLAFMTLCKFEKGNRPGEHELMTWETATEAEKERLWAWAVSRCILCVFEHDVDIIKSAHNVTTDKEVCEILLAYAKKTLDRFSTVKDTTTRVLSGGIVNRYQTRLKMVQDFLDASKPDSSPAGRELLRQAGISAETLQGHVRALVADAKRFASTEGQADQQTPAAPAAAPQQPADAGAGMASLRSLIGIPTWMASVVSTMRNFGYGAGEDKSPSRNR
uniref:Uncharacterized protein n=1 Tax=Chromera velia CCMP2878 TaxID=1169474 RepID=A0A0G4I719_9ALVE|mmetsp:Transcript_33089/g.65650  ORF Transcript_33089/g.65650 Transcript_33089/m.65650 type:complete len:616 (-) Transcript_33089:1-1848(-)|eukprot:Cvel_11551.t1-p1 / transcript=Cvel_11551.t1 / gene=Cvel_11551 / organism=Chromera_velia_CCMP2878 / gene_product=hypothetical protein / transcript_product=hypothetical protein / location=Cvel_scaffold729:58340-61993(+) / protein_length=615 / sequence_SO=supercontig / SO=protein_coding / is_pseudo=false